MDGSEAPGPVAGVKRYGWEEIESLTMNFKEVIGVGGYSTVYLAKFPNKALGAVKVYNGSERLNQVFKNELEINQKLAHPKIVKLIGYCDETEGGVLVFEYIPKGNLQEHLHNSKSPSLTWKQRVSIAYQVAQALSYLHEGAGSLQLVHGDIKASNILLDEHLEPLLCDFGLAKEGFSSMVKPPSSSRGTPMMGSPGYIDPHFLMTGMASKKSDVYSFGVILLELITGIEPLVVDSGERHVRLTSVVRTSEGFDMEKVAKMVDPRLGSVDEEEVKALGSIAGLCLHQLPSLRPPSSEICNMIKERFFFIS